MRCHVFFVLPVHLHVDVKPTLESSNANTIELESPTLLAVLVIIAALLQSNA